jgi:DNA-binding LacI/PurR family transcriptional regulator
MVTARTVADALGVAVSTVGRALADDPRISAETKTKVRRAAEKLGYVSSNPARIMRGGSSKMIGLMIPDVANDFYSAVAQTLSTCLDRQGYGLLLSLTEDDREREARQIRELMEARAAGVIIVPTPKPKAGSKAMLARIPHVQFLRRLPSLGNIWFGIDDGPAIQRAAEHLIAHGHRRLAYIGGFEQLSTGEARVLGFRTALANAGIDPTECHEMMGPPAASFGFEAAKSLVELASPPTAILTGSVHITLGVIQLVERLGIDTPQKLSLIGFGDAPWFDWWRGGLTTVQPPVRDLATSCGLWFLDHLGKNSIGAESQHASTMQSALVVRHSVGCVPA